MRPSRAVEVLSGLLSTRWPAFLWGPPGIGKSSIVKQVAADKGLAILDVRAPLLDPTDLRGLPYVADGSAKWAPPAFLPQNDGSEGLLFFDELNAAPPLVQASLYQLTLDRRVGEYVLPDGWRIIAAGNRSEDAAIVFRMPSALANRFIHIDFEANHEDWQDWAAAHQIHPLVQAFLRLRSELLLDMTNMDRGFPTPRSWEMVSDALKAFGEASQILDVLIGTIGEGAAIEFVSFCKRTLTAEMVEAIIYEPEKSEIPRDMGDLYALISYLAAKGEREAVVKAAGKILSRISPEIATILARMMIKSNGDFSLNKDFLKFTAKHRDFVI
jgi:MoxR-like ATPase